MCFCGTFIHFLVIHKHIIFSSCNSSSWVFFRGEGGGGLQVDKFYAVYLVKTLSANSSEKYKPKQILR